MKQIKELFEEARLLLAAIKAAYPARFEYFLQCTVYADERDTDQRTQSVEAFDVKDMKSLVYYKNRLQDRIYGAQEAARLRLNFLRSGLFA